MFFFLFELSTLELHILAVREIVQLTKEIIPHLILKILVLHLIVHWYAAIIVLCIDLRVLILSSSLHILFVESLRQHIFQM